MSLKQESNDAFEITLNYLAKEILRQVAVDVSNKPYCAYIYSRFAYMICSSIPEFTDYLLGRLYKRCPYIVPQFHDDDPVSTHIFFYFLYVCFFFTYAFVFRIFQMKK